MIYLSNMMIYDDLPTQSADVPKLRWIIRGYVSIWFHYVPYLSHSRESNAHDVVKYQRVAHLKNSRDFKRKLPKKVTNFSRKIVDPSLDSIFDFTRFFLGLCIDVTSPMNWAFPASCAETLANTCRCPTEFTAFLKSGLLQNFGNHIKPY